MKGLFLFLFALLFFDCAGQVNNDCFHVIKKSDWNLSICIDTMMGVNSSDEFELQIMQYETSDQGKSTRRLSITLDYNYENRSAKEILENQFSNKPINGLREISRQDSVLGAGGNQFYLVNWIFENEKRDTLALSAAIGFYENQYYTFQTFGPTQNHEPLNFLCKVLNRISYIGEPTLKNDKAIIDNFLSTLTLGIKVEEKLKDILINAEIFLSTIPEKERESLSQDLPLIEMRLNNWNQTVYAFIRAMNKYESVVIKKHDFKRDISQPNLTGYMALVVFDCDGEEISYRLICMEVDGLMYLGRMVKV
ncbi:hypothetical protein KFE98_13480 [bacterium SCSIO 12741]|nr:hypothetical protein KFE98_13480 [bacterium SCSIO 12741]